MKYIRLGSDEILTKEKFIPIKNTIDSNKPYPKTGLWASEYNSETISSWFQWCKNEGFNIDKLDKGIIFDFKETRRMLIIDKRSDLDNLDKKYKFLPIKSNIFGLRFNFEKLAEDYDVVKLT